MNPFRDSLVLNVGHLGEPARELLHKGRVNTQTDKLWYIFMLPLIVTYCRVSTTHKGIKKHHRKSERVSSYSTPVPLFLVATNTNLRSRKLRLANNTRVNSGACTNLNTIRIHNTNRSVRCNKHVRLVNVPYTVTRLVNRINRHRKITRHKQRMTYRPVRELHTPVRSMSNLHKLTINIHLETLHQEPRKIPRRGVKVP